jgi:Tfp pilus assembly protein PilF
MRHFVCVFTLLLGMSATTAMAAPYKPATDAQVLERLPFKPSDPVVRELAQMRSELQRNPQNREVAVRLALRYYGLVAEEGDPRYLGYAQAALAPWWDAPTPPTDVQLVRARMRQFLHDFPGALSDLGQVIEREPQNSQARLLRAIINIVQARYDQARIDCQALRGGADLLSLGCEATIDGLTGKAAPAYARLQAALDARPTASNDEKLWVLERLAELAQRRGQSAIAEQRLAQAIKFGNSDTFLLAAYTDLLLEQERPAEVVALLKDKVRSDGLLLRLVFAENSIKAPAAAEHEAALGARYAAAQLRGDTVHQQEEARFELRTRRDAKKALFLSQENWKVQREPRDARIFLEAAIASKNPAAAQPVLQWLDESGIEDPTLIRLGQQLKAGVK